MFTPVDIQRLQNVIQCSWSDDTHGVYGSGPLVFHVWYDKRGLLKEERTRASGASIASAVSSFAGMQIQFKAAQRMQRTNILRFSSLVPRRWILYPKSGLPPPLFPSSLFLFHFILSPAKGKQVIYKQVIQYTPSLFIRLATTRPQGPLMSEAQNT